MDKRIKKLWLKALRSRAYKQGRGMLRIGDRFCCLGVLCDLRAKETGVGWRRAGKRGAFTHSEALMVLPRVVRKWAGLDDSDPIVGIRKPTRLSDLNDRGKRFGYIADRIEKYL